MEIGTQSPDWIAQMAAYSPAQYALGGMVMGWEDRECYLEVVMVAAYPSQRSEDQ